MRRLILGLLVMLSVLVAGTGVPALAHGHHMLADHAFEHHDVDASDIDSAADDVPQPRDLAGQSGAHHHCAADVTPTGPAVRPARRVAAPAFSAGAVPVLASRAFAPALEPPSA
jgi:hypothetical protein